MSIMMTTGPDLPIGIVGHWSRVHGYVRGVGGGGWGH